MQVIELNCRVLLQTIESRFLFFTLRINIRYAASVERHRRKVKLDSDADDSDVIVKLLNDTPDLDKLRGFTGEQIV